MSKFGEKTGMLFLQSSTVVLKFTPPNKDQFLKLLRDAARTGMPCKISVVGDEITVEELEQERFPDWLLASQLELKRQRKKRLTH